MCGLQKKSIPTPLKVIGNSYGGMGVTKAKILEAKYEAKWEFLGGRGGAQQKPSVEGVRKFSGSIQYKTNDQTCDKQPTAFKGVNKYKFN